MPSKKKSSKTPSKSSSKSDPNSDDVSSVSNSVPYNDEQLLLSCLDEASAKFPSLIARTALIGKIANDAVLDSKNRRIWLSESVMVGSSIAPGSLVSVSLASFDKGGGFALSVLSDECGSQFGFDLAQNLADQAGNYFSLATVFPSSKVLKDGVRLSSNVLHTLGCPASGRTVFVYPVKCQRLIENGNGKQSGSETSCFSLNSCKELYLRPIYLKGKSKIETTISSHLNLSKESTNGHVENSKISSPRTPSRPESRVSSPCSSQSRTSNYFTSALRSSYSSHASTDILDIKEVLEDDSSRKLIETCIASWLCSQSFLPGNFVIVPILSRLLVFQVIGSEGFLLNSEVGNGKNLDFPTRTPDLGEDMVTAFSIDWGTKIHLLVPGNNVVETSVEFSSAHPENGLRYKEDSTVVNFAKLGGLSKEFAVLKDIVISSAVNVKVASLGLRPTKGVLLHGPPGTGKTTLARLCAHDAGVNLFPVNGPEIISLYHGETEQALHEVFDKASQAAPAVVFIDELDAIAPARKEGGDDLSQRMVATLLNLMDGISRTDGILIIAATNRPDSIEPALRRPGRLDREIEIGVPSPGQRLEILHTLLREMEHSLCDRDIQHLSMVTHGFVGADLAALCNEAALVRLRQYVNLSTSHGYPDSTFSTVAFDSVCQTSSLSPDLCSANELDASESRGDSMNGNLEAAFYRASETKNSSDFMDETGENANCIAKNTLRVTPEDFEKARIRIRPSAMREVILEVPKVGWEDVGGQTEIKMQLMEAVEWPQKHSEAFKRVGTRPPYGILLFGPPGCSKTLLARAVASEAGLNFLAVKGPELFSKWVGESEKAVRSLFAKARANAPSIIFFDEIDGLAITRGKESDGVSVGDRVISQLLVELDGLQERGSVTVIAATNRPDKIDAALLRPGRFDRLLYVGPPNQKDREDIFRVHLQRMPCSSDVCISELSLLTEGCTGADISLICREAAIAAMEENLSASEITMEHLKVGIHHVQPSNVQMFEKLSTKFQRLVHSTADKDDLRYEPCSSEQGHIPLWRRIKSAAHSLLQRGS